MSVGLPSTKEAGTRIIRTHSGTHQRTLIPYANESLRQPLLHETRHPTSGTDLRALFPDILYQTKNKYAAATRDTLRKVRPTSGQHPKVLWTDISIPGNYYYWWFPYGVDKKKIWQHPILGNPALQYQNILAGLLFATCVRGVSLSTRPTTATCQFKLIRAIRYRGGGEK